MYSHMDRKHKKQKCQDLHYFKLEKNCKEKEKKKIKKILIRNLKKDHVLFDLGKNM